MIQTCVTSFMVDPWLKLFDFCELGPIPRAFRDVFYWKLYLFQYDTEGIECRITILWLSILAIFYCKFEMIFLSQLRMDFNSFVITGPNTLTTSIFYNLQGNVVATSLLKVGQSASLATQCQTDSFTVTGSGGATPPVICGTNTGYHSLFWHFFQP